MVIEELRKKLHNSIAKYGLTSSQAYQDSIELDKEIEEYYDSPGMKYYYQISLKEFYNLKRDLRKIPSTKEWNQYAKKKNLLCSESMKYIGKIKFR